MFLMNALLKLRAKENNVSQTLIANNTDLTYLARGKKDGLKILIGWRRDLVGNELLSLLEGKIGLTCNGNELKILQTD